MYIFSQLCLLLFICTAVLISRLYCLLHFIYTEHTLASLDWKLREQNITQIKPSQQYNRYKLFIDVSQWVSEIVALFLHIAHNKITYTYIGVSLHQSFNTVTLTKAVCHLRDFLLSTLNRLPASVQHSMAGESYHVWAL